MNTFYILSVHFVSFYLRVLLILNLKYPFENPTNCQDPSLDAMIYGTISRSAYLLLRGTSIVQEFDQPLSKHILIIEIGHVLEITYGYF